MEKKFFFQNKSGYTLVETLVSVSIIAIISSIYIMGYKSYNQQGGVRLAGHVLASEIRIAQNSALSQREFNGNPPAGGWGVFFDLSKPTQYIIFADLNEDGAYDDGEAEKTGFLANGVKINALSPDSDPNQDTVVFIPPEPITRINQGSAITDLIITLDNGWKVKINFLGLIDVVNN